jgi:hypothetical protein
MVTRGPFGAAAIPPRDGTRKSIVQVGFTLEKAA